MPLHLDSETREWTAPARQGVTLSSAGQMLCMARRAVRSLDVQRGDLCRAAHMDGAHEQSSRGRS